jgi:hypothetical protein
LQKWYYRQHIVGLRDDTRVDAGASGDRIHRESNEGPRPPTVYCDDTEGCITNSDFDEQHLHARGINASPR